MNREILSTQTSIAAQTIMLVVLQVTVTSLLWILNPLGQGEADFFALLLSVDLLAFAILSYQYRARRWGGLPDASWIALGYFVIVVLLTASLLVV